MEIEGYKCCDIVNLWSVVLQKSGTKPSLVFREDFLEEAVLVLSQMERVWVRHAYVKIWRGEKPFR